VMMMMMMMGAQIQRVSRQYRRQNQIYNICEWWKVQRKGTTMFFSTAYCIFHSSYIQIFTGTLIFEKAYNLCSSNNLRDCLKILYFEQWEYVFYLLCAFVGFVNKKPKRPHCMAVQIKWLNYCVCVHYTHVFRMLPNKSIWFTHWYWMISKE
jgi:hypothetical protein